MYDEKNLNSATTVEEHGDFLQKELINICELFNYRYYQTTKKRLDELGDKRAEQMFPGMKKLKNQGFLIQEVFLALTKWSTVDYYIAEKANEIFDRGESNASDKESTYGADSESINRHEKFKRAMIIAKERLEKTDSLYIKSIQNEYLY